MSWWPVDHVDRETCMLTLARRKSSCSHIMWKCCQRKSTPCWDVHVRFLPERILCREDPGIFCFSFEFRAMPTAQIYGIIRGNSCYTFCLWAFAPLQLFPRQTGNATLDCIWRHHNSFHDVSQSWCWIAQALPYDGIYWRYIKGNDVFWWWHSCRFGCHLKWKSPCVI